MIVKNGSCCRSKQMSAYGEDGNQDLVDINTDPTGARQGYGFFKLIGALTLAGVATNVISNMLDRKRGSR